MAGWWRRRRCVYVWLLSVQEYVTLHACLPSSAAVPQLHRRLRCSRYLNTADKRPPNVSGAPVCEVGGRGLHQRVSRAAREESYHRHRDSSRESNPAVTMTGEMDESVGGGCGCGREADRRSKVSRTSPGSAGHSEREAQRSSGRLPE